MDFLVLILFITVFIIVLLFLGEKILISSILRPKKTENQLFPSVKEKFPGEERFTVNSASDIPISFRYIPLNDEGNKPQKIVILFHEYNSSSESMDNYIPMFRERGFSVIVPDARFCGKSGGEYLGLSYLDAEDSSAIFKWINDCFGYGIPIGLFGESFGAAQAIILACSGKYDNISFVVSDSSYSDLYSLIKERVRADYRIKPFPLLFVARLIIKKKYGIDMKKVSPEKLLKTCGAIPMFFIHGDSDTFVLPQMSIDLYNAKETGYKKFYLAENASHCEAFNSDPQTYRNKLFEFFDKIKI